LREVVEYQVELVMPAAGEQLNMTLKPLRGCEQRISVVGTTGSGKTTLSERLADCLGVPHVELDALHWGPNWTELDPETLRAKVARIVQRDAWVIDGNYSAVRELVWERAQAVVWLDYGLPTILGRLVWRTIRRVITGEKLWAGNRERLWTQIATRDSILLWALRTYRRRRREYPRLIAEPANAHLRIAHLRSPRAADAWITRLGSLQGISKDCRRHL